MTKLMNKLLGKCVRYVRIGVWNTQKGIHLFSFHFSEFSYERHFFPNGYSSAIRPRYQTHFLPTTYRVEQQHKIHIGWNPSAKCSKWIQHLHFTWTNIAFSRQCDDIDQVRCLPLAHQSITANGILSEILENICKENKFHLIKGTIKTSINACEKKASEKYSTELFQCLPIYMCMIYAYDVCHIH